MARRSLISTGLIGFGVGLVVGSGFRRTTGFAAGFLERLGFELDEMVWSFWENRLAEEDKVAERVGSGKPRRGPVGRRAVKRRAFSNGLRRPASLKLIHP